MGILNHKEETNITKLKKEQRQFDRSENSWIWIALVFLIGIGFLIWVAIVLTD